MLINEPLAVEMNVIRMLIGEMGGRTEVPKQIDTGIYVIPHFGGSDFMEDYKQYSESMEDCLSIGRYGVCDNHQQILDQCPEIQDTDRQFVICLTPVRKKDQSPNGGWRWHKWGEYIGDHTPTCEYLFDEPEIEEVFVYQIYEKVD